MASSADSLPRVSTTVLLGCAAVATAAIALFGEKGNFDGASITAALLGLVPWAVVVGGVEVRPWLFALATFLPAAYLVLIERNAGAMFPLMLLVVWITRVSASRALVAGTIVASLACIVGLAIMEGSVHETGLVYFAGGIGISWLAGTMLRRQELLTAEVRAMGELQVEQMAATERARLARDVHDVVAHSLTIVMLNLTGARRALATQPERADEALARAEAVGRESLDSIRQVMGVLREPCATTELPQPGLVALPALVDGYRGAGLSVALDVDERLTAGGLDSTIELVLYRVVQESLANALQHAPGAPASVRITGEPGVVRIDVATGPPTTPTSGSSRTGLGVRGMIERVRAVGGELRAGPDGDGGGWLVTATIPLRSGPFTGLPPRPSDELSWVTPTR